MLGGATPPSDSPHHSITAWLVRKLGQHNVNIITSSKTSGMCVSLSTWYWSKQYKIVNIWNQPANRAPELQGHYSAYIYRERVYSVMEYYNCSKYICIILSHYCFYHFSWSFHFHQYFPLQMEHIFYYVFSIELAFSSIYCNFHNLNKFSCGASSLIFQDIANIRRHFSSVLLGWMCITFHQFSSL